MKPEFSKKYVEQVDLLVNLSQDFDWSTLSDRLGEEKEPYAGAAKDLEVLCKVLNLLLGNADGEKINVRRVGLNVIGLGWVLNPGLFDGSPSVRTLARRCGVSAAALADATGRISRLIGWRNRAQSHAWNWKPTRSTPNQTKGKP